MSRNKNLDITTGMEQEKYISILNEYTNWITGTSITIVSEPIPNRKHENKYDRQAPERGYPIVLSYKIKGGPCGWCGEHTEAVKQYSREHGSNLWEAKCKDKECKRKMSIHSSQIGQESLIMLGIEKEIVK